MVLSCTYEEHKKELVQNLKFLKMMIVDDRQFLEVKALGEELAWTVMKLWMKTEGRNLNNYQWRVVGNALEQCTLPIFCKLDTGYDPNNFLHYGNRDPLTNNKVHMYHSSSFYFDPT